MSKDTEPSVKNSFMERATHVIHSSDESIDGKPVILHRSDDGDKVHFVETSDGQSFYMPYQSLTEISKPYIQI